MSVEIFRKCGGCPEYRHGLYADGDDIVWNFGLLPKPLQMSVVSENPRGLYDTFPNLQGRWDRKTPVCHHNAVRTVLGEDLKAHHQRLGTCGGHAGSRTLELLQCLLIASGKRAKFHYVSHAWIYFLARRKYGMLGGGDGVAGGSVPEVLAEFGALHREESGDPDMDGQQVDAVAGRWGGGRLSQEDVRRFEGFANDNLVTARVRARSADELADGLAAGGVCVCSDMRGFTLERNRDGVCSPKGSWAHYHVRSGLAQTSSGQWVFGYDQSWGSETPRGPLLPGWPSNCFGVEWDVQDQCCKRGEYDILFGFDLWDLEKGNYDIPWIFLK